MTFRARGTRARPFRTRFAAALAALATLLAGAAPAASGAGISGTVRLLLDGRVASTDEVRDAVVYWMPERAVAAPPAAQPVDIVMREKVFVPHIVAVTRGSSVRFPNADPILHNVFSISPENVFDLGLYGAGPGKSVRLDAAGVVRVYCNVHHSMSAHVLVLETPFFVSPGPTGQFTLDGLPDGPGTLHVWHARTESWNQGLTLPAADPVLVSLPITRRRVAPHLDKSGRPYRETRGDKSYR